METKYLFLTQFVSPFLRREMQMPTNQAMLPRRGRSSSPPPKMGSPTSITRPPSSVLRDK